MEFRQHFYSAPYALMHEEAMVRATASTVELLVKGMRVASHLRDDTPGKYLDRAGAHAEGAPRSR